MTEAPDIARAKGHVESAPSSELGEQFFPKQPSSRASCPAPSGPRSLSSRFCASSRRSALRHRPRARLRAAVESRVGRDAGGDRSRCCRHGRGDRSHEDVDRGAKLSPSPAQLHLRLRHEMRQALGARVHVLGEFVERLLRRCFCHVGQPCGFFGVNPAATFCECLNGGQAPLRNHLRSVRVLSASGTLQKNVLLQESDGE